MSEEEYKAWSRKGWVILMAMLVSIGLGVPLFMLVVMSWFASP